MTAKVIPIRPTPLPTQDTQTEIEQALCGILVSCQTAAELARVMADISGTICHEMFLHPVHGEIFLAAKESVTQGLSADCRALMRRVSADSFGGDEAAKRAYFVGLVGSLAIPSEAVRLALEIKRFHIEREVQAVANSDMPAVEKAEIMARLCEGLRSSSVDSVVSLGAALDAAYSRTDDLNRNGGICGAPTGLTDLDNALYGLEDGGLYVLAGRPAMGKTAAALTIAMNVAERGLPVLFFSLEMSSEQLAHRVNARYAGVSIGHQKGRGTTPHDFLALSRTRGRLGALPLKIVDQSGLTADQICAKAREIAKGQRQSLIVIDHLGIVAARDPRSPRVYQVAEMTAAFKTLARELRCPVLMLHQLNRGVEARDDKRPTLSDLRDSGSVEQDADVVMLLYRAEYYLKNREPRTDREREQWERDIAEAKNMAEIIIAKNRQGEDGTVRLRFDGHRQVFENLEAR